MPDLDDTGPERSSVVARAELPLPERFTDVSRVAYGGMADIYTAHDSVLDRTVAIKVVAERLADDADLRERFMREARTAARLSGHPHVVPIYDVGEADGLPYLVMPFVSGGTVADVLRRRGGAVSPLRALEWLRQTASALDAAHEHSVVHRDVKPANLLLDEADRVLVSDFGIARALDQATGGMTATGTVLGTAGYLSPEQAEGKSASTASDIYALGVVAFELLTGKRPYQRQSSMAEAAAHLHEPVPRATDAARSLPVAVDRVFDRVLAKDPGDRYPTAGAFVADLEQALQQARVGRTLMLGSRRDGGGIHIGSRDSGKGVFDDGGTTRVLGTEAGQVWTRRHAQPRRWSRLVLLALPLALLAIVGLAVGRQMTGPAADPAGTGDVRTVTAQVTGETRTVVRTVPAAPGGDDRKGKGKDGDLSRGQARQLNDDAFVLMNRGRYADAVPLLERALPALAGDAPYEAYANYNLGKSLLETGRCDEALEYLDRSEQLQGYRREIEQAQREARACAS